MMTCLCGGAGGTRGIPVAVQRESRGRGPLRGTFFVRLCLTLPLGINARRGRAGCLNRWSISNSRRHIAEVRRFHRLTMKCTFKF